MLKDDDDGGPIAEAEGSEDEEFRVSAAADGEELLGLRRAYPVPYASCDEGNPDDNVGDSLAHRSSLLPPTVVGEDAVVSCGGFDFLFSTLVCPPNIARSISAELSSDYVGKKISDIGSVLGGKEGRDSRHRTCHEVLEGYHVSWR